MKKVFVGFFVMLFWASTVWGVSINLDEGGWEYDEADTILGYSYVTPANPENEADFANEVLAAYNIAEEFDYNFELIEYPIVFTKFDGLSGLDITLNAGFTWTYAVVKVDGPNDYSYLFWNTYGDSNYLTTPSAGTIPFNMGLNHPQGQGYDISHVTFFGEGGTPVPEPGMVILLGIGLFGLAFYNRKRLLN